MIERWVWDPGIAESRNIRVVFVLGFVSLINSLTSGKNNNEQRALALSAKDGESEKRESVRETAAGKAPRFYKASAPLQVDAGQEDCTKRAAGAAPRFASARSRRAALDDPAVAQPKPADVVQLHRVRKAGRRDAAAHEREEVERALLAVRVGATAVHQVQHVHGDGAGRHGNGQLRVLWVGEPLAVGDARVVGLRAGDHLEGALRRGGVLERDLARDAERGARDDLQGYTGAREQGCRGCSGASVRGAGVRVCGRAGV